MAVFIIVFHCFLMADAMNHHYENIVRVACHVYPVVHFKMLDAVRLFHIEYVLCIYCMCIGLIALKD
jgi:hypothetical protein